jgi:hypothetical protein
LLKKGAKTMNKKAESPSGDFKKQHLANAVIGWKEGVRENCSFLLLVSAGIGLILGYFISQHEEAKKRELWAETLFRQARNWLSEHGEKAAGMVSQGLEDARLAAGKAAGKGVEYGHRVNPFRKENQRRFLGIF